MATVTQATLVKFDWLADVCPPDPQVFTLGEFFLENDDGIDEEEQARIVEALSRRGVWNGPEGYYLKLP